MRHIRYGFVLLMIAVLSALAAQADVAFPAELSTIEDRAFLNDAGLTGVLVIPEGVTEIGAEAFSGCTGLTGVVIPDSVTKIGWGAFSGCTNLTGDLLLRYYVEVGDGCFDGCAGVTVRQETDADSFAYVISDGEVTISAYTNRVHHELIVPGIIDGFPVTRIGSSAFCGGFFSSIELPDGLKAIEEGAFRDCSSLISVSLPESLVSIGDSAFRACFSMTGIVLPDSLTRIGDSAFSECIGLERIAIPEHVTYLGSSAFFNCYALTSVTLPGKLTCISSNTFRCCYQLSEVVIPEGVTTIGSYAFSEINLLQSVELPGSVTTIDEHAFEMCWGLSEVWLPEGITSVGTDAFINTFNVLFHYPLHSVTARTMQANCNPVFCDADYQCHFQYVKQSGDELILNLCFQSDMTPRLPDGIVHIGSGAFRNSGITSFNVPETVTYIGSYAFASCSDLTSISLPDSITDIGDHAFDSCQGLTGLILPTRVTVISSDTFSNCSSLRSITLPPNVEAVRSNAFYGCSSLESIVLPDSVTFVGVSAFEACVNLRSIVIPSNITTVGENAFSQCPFTEWTYPLHSLTAKSMRNCFNPVFYDATYCCKFQYVSATDDDLYLWLYDHSNTVPELPSGIVAIRSHAFSGKGITRIDVPDTVKTIESFAFRGCRALTSVSLPYGLSWIDKYAFLECDHLTGIAIPDSVTHIGEGAFQDCTSLISVVFPRLPVVLEACSFANTSLTGRIRFQPGSVIDENAFYGCTGLTYELLSEVAAVEYITRDYIVRRMDAAMPPESLLGNMEAEENSDIFEQFVYAAVSFSQGDIAEPLLSTHHKKMYLFHEALAVNSGTQEVSFIPEKSKIALDSIAEVWHTGAEATNQHIFDTVVVLCDEVFLTDIEADDVAKAFKDFYTKPDGADEIFTFLVEEGLNPDQAADVMDAFGMLSTFRVLAKGLNGVVTVYDSMVDLYNDLQFLKTLDRASLLATARVYRNSNDPVMQEVGERLMLIAVSDEETQTRNIALGHFADFGLRQMVNKAFEKATDIIPNSVTVTIKITNAFLNSLTHVGEIPHLVHELEYAADAANGTWYVFQNDLAAYHANPTEENLTTAYRSYVVYMTEARKSQQAFIKLKVTLDNAPAVSIPPETAELVELARTHDGLLATWLDRAQTMYRLRREGSYEDVAEYLNELMETMSIP